MFITSKFKRLANISNKMIKIKNFAGVAPPTEESKVLLECILSLKGEDVLELGTGTGYVAIAASKEGKKVIATDINPKAVETCKINVKLNNINLIILQSDLFKNVRGKFDIIAFNPPISIDKAGSNAIHRVKSFIRSTKLLRTILRYTYSKLNKSILRLIDELFIDAKEHLKENGSILICVINNFEEDIKRISDLNGYNNELMKNFNYGKVYRFTLR